MIETIAKLAKVFWYGVVLNPYLMCVIGGNLIGLLLIRRLNGSVSKWPTYLSVGVILGFMILSVARCQHEKNAEKLSEENRQADIEEEKKKKEAEEKLPLTERAYYMDYNTFRDSLELTASLFQKPHNLVDSIVLDALRSHDHEYFEGYKNMSIEGYRRKMLTTEDKIKRAFFPYYDKNSGRFFENTYLPLIDTLYNRVRGQKALYIHNFRSSSYSDSTFWQLSIDYETDIIRDTFSAELDIRNNILLLE